MEHGLGLGRKPPAARLVRQCVPQEAAPQAAEE